MKHIKLFEHFISEAKQIGTLYHYTDYRGALGILKDGELRSDVGGALGTLKDPYYSISFTRDKNFHKVARTLTQVGSNIPCRFTFDGNKISNNYSFSPYAQQGFEKGKKSFEAEERIVEKNPFSISISKYLISFDIVPPHPSSPSSVCGDKINTFFI
jgi:hypothetical protein